MNVAQRERSYEDGKRSHHKSRKTVFERTWRASVLVLVALTVSILVRVVPRFPAWVVELSLSVLAAVTVHLLDRLVLYRDTEEELDNALANLKKDIESTTDELVTKSTALTTSSLDKIERGVAATIAGQTDSLVAQTRSLAAMTGSGIVQIYPSRKDAAEDILRDLTNVNTTKIYIIGISLNDFTLSQEDKLGRAWEAIRSCVISGRGLTTKERGLRIRVLIIDPDSFGAALRSGGELREKPVFPGTLGEHVRGIASLMSDLVKIAAEKSKDTGVTFECRLYRTPPVLFLCLVDSVCYVEQYHFWSKRVVGTPIPVLKYRRDDESTRFYPMHTQMEQHFDWVWEKASVGINEFQEQHAVGIESGMNLSSAVNVYTDPDVVRERMMFLLEHARHQVDIQGVSLHSFLKNGSPLLGALESLIRAGEVRIRMLFIDRMCEQAKFRSTAKLSSKTQA